MTYYVFSGTLNPTHFTSLLGQSLATQFGPLSNTSGSTFDPLTPLQTQFGPLRTVH